MHLVHKENRESKAHPERVDNLGQMEKRVNREPQEIQVVKDSKEIKERLVKRY